MTKRQTKSAKAAAGQATESPSVPRLHEDEVNRRLEARPDWTLAGESIQRTYFFKNFIEAMAFVNKTAQAAEASQHHPDLLIRYNKVTVTLSTHDAGGISHKDFELAEKLDAMGAEPSGSR
jgi:4a-hydroxytetrahydrobiopterin dehydratase